MKLFSSKKNVSSSETQWGRELQVNRLSVRACRELLVLKAFLICSFRVPRTDNASTSSSRLSHGKTMLLELTRFPKFNFAKFLLTLTILFSISLFPQEAINSQYSHIKQLIVSKQLNKAREEIKLAMAGNENDPTLNLYQTELWIAEGDYYYSAGQYRRSLAIYEKAIEQYPSNPMVKLKYQEMVNKMKAMDAEAKENKSKDPLLIQPLGLQGGLAQNSESMRDPANTPTSINFAMSRTEFLLTFVCLQNFIIMIFLFLRLPKRG